MGLKMILALVCIIPGSFVRAQTPCTAIIPAQDSVAIIRQLAQAETRDAHTACIDQVATLALQLQAICKQQHFNDGLAGSYQLLGFVLCIKGNPDSAQVWFRKAEAIAHGDRLYWQKAYLGWTYRDKSNYPAASALLYTALEYAGTHGDTALEVFSRLQLGQLNVSIKNFPRADTLLRSALQIAKAAHLQTYIAGICFPLADLNVRWEHYPEAEALLKESITIASAEHSIYDLAHDYNELARMAVVQQHYAEAEINYNKSKTYKQQLGDLHGLAVLYNNLGDLYTQQYQDPKAIAAFKQSLQLSSQINATDVQQVALANLAVLHELDGNYKEALYYKKESTTLHDSLWNIAKSKEIIALDEKYKVAEKEKAIISLHAAAQLSEANARVKTRQRNLWIAGFIFICIIIIIGLYAFLQKLRLNRIITAKNEELQQLNKTKDYLFRVIGHDIRMPLSGLGRIADLIDYCLKNNQVVQLLKVGDDMKVTVQHIDHLLSNLLTWGLSQTGQLAFSPERVPVYRIFQQVAASFQVELQKKSATLQPEFDEHAYAVADVNSLKVILRNLIANAIKFTPEGSTIVVRIGIEGAQCLIRVKDAGVGISASQTATLFNGKRQVNYQGPQSGMGVGLFISQEMAILNGGSIFVSNPGEPGAEFVCALPA
jgi:signal transduction histidine kinase